MDSIAAGVVVLGALIIMSLASRWAKPVDRVKAEEDEKRAIERQGELHAAQAELHKPKTMGEVADEFNKTFK